jgi:hypothetical protein
MPGEVLVKVHPAGGFIKRLADRVLGAQEAGRLDALGVARMRMPPGFARTWRPFLRACRVEYANPTTV